MQFPPRGNIRRVLNDSIQTLLGAKDMLIYSEFVIPAKAGI